MEHIVKEAEKIKKQVPLRLSSALYGELSRWAEEDFRSLNGQIEFLLTECVRKRKRGKSAPVPAHFEGENQENGN